MFATIAYSRQRNRYAWVTSAMFHIAGAVLLLQFGSAVIAPSVHRRSSTLILLPSPARDTVEPARLPKPKLRVFKLPHVPPVKRAELAHKSPVLMEAPAIKPAPVLSSAPSPAIKLPPPPPQIRTGMLDSSQQAASAQPRPVPVVQTGGFLRDLPNEPKRNPQAAIQLAGFDSTANQKNPNEPKLAVASAGFGEGRTPKSQNEPKSVSTGGFGGSVLTASASGGPIASTQTVRAGFGDTTVGRTQPVTRPASSLQPSDSTPFEITFKPRPEYTPEARLRQLQGEVAVETLFRASGEIEIVRIIRGLGHGLNESAVAAVRAIRFRPAKQHGQPVDSIATVRMTFELAY